MIKWVIFSTRLGLSILYVKCDRKIFSYLVQVTFGNFYKFNLIRNTINIYKLTAEIDQEIKLLKSSNSISSIS